MEDLGIPLFPDLPARSQDLDIIEHMEIPLEQGETLLNSKFVELLSCRRNCFDSITLKK